ncbi:hypothetical protein FA09DRAFT_331102 [Tilletiopsis washingtonensis]|uniref:Uncharacterized protein n=1 Tax=Tilletiopsis washingtonensis TaxID=58919 RepID=A0A316Z6M1_9BASI|nr:hypothetical protein FA09DRAFT_331102 [Tilletiopsis washingtonensis]PWN96608.1 hypothetical protein FA09DRAFT_331102 [Tilletiopsis washingtonensis]
MSYVLSPSAHSTLLAHVAAHPHASVCGLLLSSLSSSSSSSSSAPVHISRALPLTHTHSALSPTLEAGLALAQAHASEEKCSVVGVYVAHANVASSHVDPRTARLARSACGEGSEALVLVLDASALPSPRALRAFLLPASAGASSSSAAAAAAQAQALPASALDAGDEARMQQLLLRIRAGERVRDWDGEFLLRLEDREGSVMWNASKRG